MKTRHRLLRDLKVVAKPYDTPVCRFAVYRDTEGNAFLIHAKKRA